MMFFEIHGNSLEGKKKKQIPQTQIYIFCLAAGPSWDLV